jgi:hypothetical protein
VPRKKPTEYANFTKAVKKILRVSKRESDEQMARMQASNKVLGKPGSQSLKLCQNEPSIGGILPIPTA